MMKEMKKNGKDENNEIYSTEKNRQFMEEILREFDKSNIGNKVEETSDEKTRYKADYFNHKSNWRQSYQTLLILVLDSPRLMSLT